MPSRSFASCARADSRPFGRAGACAINCWAARQKIMTWPPTPRRRKSARLFGRRRTLAIGAAFGVITVLGPESAGMIEVATFRKDAAYSDGRHPDHVTFSSAQEDAARRDFTINGLFYDPLENRVIDFVGGQEDLARRKIRAIGHPRERFAEDKLRMLRAVRFSATFDFALEEETQAAISEMAGQIGVVSPERIAMEMRRMLVEPSRVAAVRLLLATNLAAVVLPEIVPKNDEQSQLPSPGTDRRLVAGEGPGVRAGRESLPSTITGEGPGVRADGESLPSTITGEGPGVRADRESLPSTITGEGPGVRADRESLPSTISGEGPG